MEEFVSGFEKLGIPASTPMDYRGAEDFARQFKKCSALKEQNIHYSASTSSDNSGLDFAIQNKFSSPDAAF